MRYEGEKARRRRMEGKRKRRKEQSRGRGEQRVTGIGGKNRTLCGDPKGRKKKKRKERAPVQSIVWFGDLSWDLFFIYFYFSFIEYSTLAIHLLF